MVTAALFAGLLSGCAEPAKPPAVQAPVQGGTLILAQPLDPTGLDPALGTDSAAVNLYAVLYDTLVMYKPGDKLEVAPGLAESWTVSPDGLTYTFKLRKNVKFTDGSTFDAEAVKFNLDRELDTKNEYHAAEMTFAANIFSQMASYKVVDQYTFEMKLKQPFAGFLEQLTSYAAGGMASPTAIKKAGKDYFKSPVGTGPFVFAEWKKDDRISFKPNKDYWGGAPKLESLIVRTIPESATQLAELKSGGINMTFYGLNQNDMAQAEKDTTLTVKSLPALSSYMLHFRAWKKPFSDLRLRQAVSYAINKENIAKFILQGKAQPGTAPMPKASWAYYPTDPYPYNPDKAKALLAEAGYPNGGLKVELLTNPHMQPATEAMQADLEKVGFDVEMKRTEGGAFWDQLPTEVGDMIMDNWWLPNGDPDYLLGAMFHTNSIEKKSNVDRYSNKEVDALLEQAAKETDQAKRAELYNKVQAQVLKDLPCVSIYYLDNLFAYRNAVKGLEFYPLGVFFNKAYVEGK
jgi:peptide/nickel transport system substrate-binding protein